MQARVYFNTSGGTITSKLDQTPFSWPQIPQGEDIVLKFQLSQRNGGVTELSDLELKSATARIGNPGSAPEFGHFQLVINPPETANNVTAEIPFNFSGQQLQAAINDLGSDELGSLHPCTVTQANGASRIQFADNAADVNIEVASNALWPASFVLVKEQNWDEGNLYVLEVVQTSFALSSNLLTRPPDLPKVFNEGQGTQRGNSEDGLVINEIQKLVIPASFAGGAFQLSHGGRVSNLIALPTSDEDLAEAITGIAEPEGFFRVRSSSLAFYIEFLGSMGGEPQEKLTVIPFDPPSEDHYLKIKTRKAEMEALMRQADANGEVATLMHIELRTKNEIEPLEDDTTIFRVPLTFTKSPNDEGNNVSLNLAWNQPPSRATLLPHSTRSRLVGHRSHRFVIGDGVQTSFPLPHNLNGEAIELEVDSAENAFTAVDHNFHNLDPVTFVSTDTLPAEIVEGKTYWITERTDDSFKVSERMNGVAIDLTTDGTGTITAKINDGASDGVIVDVWERTGNRARIPDDAYTVEQTSDSLTTVKGFANPPGANEYVVYITSIGRPAQWQDAEWPQNRVIGLEDRFAVLESRVAALEDVAPKDFRRKTSSSQGEDITEMAPVQKIFPTVGRAAPLEIQPGTRIADWELGAYNRISPTLVPAVHDSAIDALPTTVSGGTRSPVDPLPQYKNGVFENQTADNVFLPVGLGYNLKPGEFAATDGVSWYPVSRYAAGETSFYPAHFEQVLWESTIEDGNLTRGREMELRFALELATYRANTPVYCHVVVETAAMTQDDSPGNTGGNYKAAEWETTPGLSQRVTLTSSPREYVFGYRVANDSAGDLTAQALAFRNWKAASPPSSERFMIRVRLIRFDTANAVEAPVGYVLVNGFRIENSRVDTSSKVGTLQIS